MAPLTIQWPSLFDPSNPAEMNPALLNPALLNPALMNPALLNPALLNPALLNPALLNPALLNPALLNPALLNPALLNPALLNPALLNNAVLNPALLNPALLNPALLNPALLNPALLNSSPSGADLNQVAYNSSLIQGTVLDPKQAPTTLTDVTWKVRNVGNDASSYFFTWFSALEQKPSQIFIYRTYKTPLARPDCTLSEDGLHYEFLANILRPDQLKPADLNAAVSFSLAPDDELYVTMRFLDPDGQTGPGGVNPALLSAQTLAQAANTSDKYATVTYVSYSPNAPVYGDKVIFTANVLSAGGNPTGNVVLQDGGNVLKTVALSASAATIDVTSLSAGSHLITVAYAGDGTFKPSTSLSLTLTIQKASPLFSNLAAATITYGQTPTVLGGLIQAGAAVPAGENVSITVAGTTVGATIGATGGFWRRFPQAPLGFRDPLTQSATITRGARTSTAPDRISAGRWRFFRLRRPRRSPRSFPTRQLRGNR